MSDFTFYEFFAGGGMARLGLGKKWECVFANDFDRTKIDCYKKNFPPAAELVEGDIRDVPLGDLPGRAQLAWASFPCQDLSLAGAGEGLKGRRSGTFWPFWDLIRGLNRENRAPCVIVLENVYGTLTSHRGRDFTAICEALSIEGYNFGALIADAALFVPQSRPRLFVVACKGEVPLQDLQLTEPDGFWHVAAIVQAAGHLPNHLQSKWVWWNLPEPRSKTPNFSDLIEDEPTGVRWHTHEETDYLLQLMSDVNMAKVDLARKLGRRAVGTIYRRTRPDPAGNKIQRAEVRFDEVAGCLRTPVGGSSRQTILVVNGSSIRSRLLSPREAARLMGLPDNYELPANYNAAYHLAGDGVVVPVVRHLARWLLEPLARAYANVPRSSAA